MVYWGRLDPVSQIWRSGQDILIGLFPVLRVDEACARKKKMDRPVVMPETFDGTGDWELYRQYFDNCAEINGWDDARRAQVLGVRLRGVAQRFHASLAARVRQDWGEATDALAGRFVQPQQTALHKSAFKNRRLRSDEQMANLADDLRRLASRAYPNADEELRDELARDQFIEGLSSAAIRLKLKEMNLVTLDQVLAQALHLEALWTTEQRTDTVTATPTVVGAVTSRSDPLADSVSKLEAVTSRFSAVATELEKAVSGLAKLSILAEHQSPRPAQDRRPRRGRACYNCGEEGHFSSSCPARQQPQPSLSRRPLNQQ